MQTTKIDAIISLYDDARKEFLKWCDTRKDLIGIEFGTVKAPGLSDLDLGIVLNYNEEVSYKDLNTLLESFPAKTKEMMNGGTLMIFQDYIFQKIHYVDDIRITGYSDFVQLTKREAFIVEIIQVLEWLPERMAKIYKELLKSDKNEKRLIGFYYSLCYTLKKILKFSGDEEQIFLFIEQVNNTRKLWEINTDIQNEESLNQLARKYMAVCIKGMQKFTNFLQKSEILVRQLKDNQVTVKYNLHSNVFLTTETLDKDSIPVKIIDSRIMISVPIEFLTSYLYYSGQQSDLGKIIENRFQISSQKKQDVLANISSEFQEILAVRSFLFSDMFDFIRQNELKTGLYKFGWYLNDNI